MVSLSAVPLKSIAQTSSPVTSPTASPDPTATSTPGGSTNPALYLPQAASVQVSSTGGANTPAVSQRKSGSRTAAKGVTNSDTSAPPAQSLQVRSPDLFSPTSLSAQPQPATITLTYNVACAGSTVLVAPLDGGAINGTPGAQNVTVGADGTLVFSFQAPSGPGRYHVLTRLNGAEISFPFDVADPAAATPVPSGN